MPGIREATAAAVVVNFMVSSKDDERARKDS
jgi:hypothetical protein